MKGSADVVVDVAIFGGGIAGLWLLDRLAQQGLSTVLFEADRLGAGQSVASQGIIHGGTKYTFGMVLDGAVDLLREMPATWGAGLQGQSRPDLTKVRTLSPCTYMWLPKQVGGGLLGAFSRSVMRSRVRRIPAAEWPDGLHSPKATGALYALDELVLDVPSVLAALQGAHRDRVRRIPDGAEVAFSEAEGRFRVGDLVVQAQRVVFAAGGGNEQLLARAGIDEIGHQRRPLHQLMIAGVKQALYVHCVGKSTKPLATITTHPSADGEQVWYVGGGIAEDGVAQDGGELIERAQRELPRLFPAADFGGARWATFRVDRAEGAVTGGRRPGGPAIESRGRFIVAWPTKLALAPALAQQMSDLLEREGVRPGQSQLDALASLPEPTVARPPWEEVVAWS